MRKLFTFLCTLLLATAFSQAVAQRNVFVWNDGYMKVVSSSSIDSVTFSADTWLFRIMTSTVVGFATSSFKATGSVALNENVKGLSETPIIGVCYSAKHTQPTISDQTVLLSSDYGTQSISVSGLARGTTYYYRVYVMLLGETYYGNICSITTLNEELVDSSKTINGHRFVDLGLPSGLLWAETNVGADNPENKGDYYAWGETTTKSIYSSSFYTKWYRKDHPGNLTATEDAATVNWGSGVRMPTRAEFAELLNTDNCIWTWTTVNGKSGYYVVSVLNGNSIFLPAADDRDELDFPCTWEEGYYWTSTPVSNYNDAYYLYFNSDDRCVNNYRSRYFGHTVRAVAK